MDPPGFERGSVQVQLNFRPPSGPSDPRTAIELAEQLRREVRPCIQRLSASCRRHPRDHDLVLRALNCAVDLLRPLIVCNTCVTAGSQLESGAVSVGRVLRYLRSVTVCSGGFPEDDQRRRMGLLHDGATSLPQCGTKLCSDDSKLIEEEAIPLTKVTQKAKDTEEAAAAASAAAAAAADARAAAAMAAAAAADADALLVQCAPPPRVGQVSILGRRSFIHPLE